MDACFCICMEKSPKTTMMMLATSNYNPSTTIICHSPTNASGDSDLIIFYNELSSLVRSIPKYKVLIIGGDMNAQIGKEKILLTQVKQK